MLSRPEGFASFPRDFHHQAVSVPCQAACPAGTDIPGYLEAIWNNDFAEAYRLNLRDNVFPAVLGRVCTRPCEPACRHGQRGNGEPVAICFAKRSADDFRTRPEPVKLPPVFPPSGKRVAIIGAGAAGLAAARELALWGHEVTVFDRAAEPGGLMIQGIPEFRLPREVARREIAQVLAQGVRVRSGVNVGVDVPVEELVAGHDAVLVATGCWSLSTPDLPGGASRGISHGLSFLMAANDGVVNEAGPRVVVIGGGFTAVDAARMARRLGAAEVTMVYRRGLEQLYISADELHQFELEGVRAEFLASPVEILHSEGAVRGVRFTRNRLTAPGADGRAGFEPVPGSEFELPADQVLLCTGQSADRTPFAVWENHPKVFFAGDVVTGPGSLIQAVGHGKAVARRLDARLMGVERLQDGIRITSTGRGSTGRPRERNGIARFPMPEIEPAARFRRAEVETGLARGPAREEAGRCYFCHYTFEIDNELCIYCDRCLKVTPVEGCIVKISNLIYDADDRIVGHVPSTGPRDYRSLLIDQDKCIRCGACVEVCPVECISLQKTSRETRVAD